MNLQNKTKEELINELQELQQAYDSLKLSIKTDLQGSEHTEEALHKNRKLLNSMEKAAKIGGWEFDVETNKQTWTEETFHILEIDTSHGAPDVPEGIGFIAPEYQPMVLLGIQRAIEFGEPYNQEWEVITTKGNKRWINAIATPYQENGKTRSVSGSFQDITKRKQAEIALLQSEENLSATLDSISDGVIATDNKGLVVRMNPVAEKLCGQLLSEAAGKPLAEVFIIINAITREGIADPVKKVLEIGDVVGLANHTLLISKNGTEYLISNSVAPIKNKEGEITGVILVFSDVTTSYVAQKQIKESEELYQSLLQNLEAGIVVHAPDTSILMNNPRASELLGLSDDQMRGRTAIDPAWKFIDEGRDPLPLGNYPVNRIVSSKKNIKNQILGIQHPGKNDIVWVTVNGFPLLDNLGEITGIVISFIDITDRKLAEDFYIESEKSKSELLNKLAEAQQIAIIGSWEWNLQTNEVWWSDETYKIFGVLSQDFKPDFEANGQFIHPDDFENYGNSFAQALRTGEELNEIFRLNTPAGDLKYINGKGKVVYDKTGKQSRFIGTVMDITARKQAELLIQEKTEEIEVQNKEYQQLNEELKQTNLELVNALDRVKETERLLAKISENYPNSFVSVIENDFTVGFSGGQEFKRQNLNPNDYFGLNIKQVFGEFSEIVTEYYLKTFSGQEVSFELFINNQHQLYKTVPLFDENNRVTRILSVVENITERKQSEKALKESEERFKNMFERHGSIMLLIEPESGMIVDANEASVSFYGYSKVELLAMRIDEINILSPEQVKMEREHAFREERKYFVFPHRLASGEVRTVEVHSSPIVIKDRQILFSIIHDITQRKQMEEQLLHSEFNLAEAERIGNTGSWDYNVATDTANWSKNMFHIFDVDTDMPTELVFKHFIENLVHPDDSQNVHSVFAEALNGIRPYDIEYRVLKKDGSIRNIHAIAETLFDDNKKAIRMIGKVADITEQKLAEIQLIKAKEKAEESEKELRLLAESMPQIVWVTRADGWNIYFSQQWVDYTGLTLEESYGHGWNKPFHPDDQKRAWEAWQNAVNNSTTYSLECRLRNKDGFYRWWLIRGVPVLNKNGEIVKWFGTCTDIHNIKLTENELIAAKEKAEESDRLKSAFLANMSHEIRTPMNGILGFAELLKTPELAGEQQQEYIKIIERSGARMLNIINNIVDISKIEAGLMKLEMKESNLNEQIEYIYTFFKPEVEAKGMNISFSTPLPATEAIILTDREKLYAILTNLGKNAIKYTEKGEIEIGYVKKGETLEFYVKDTGIGIAIDKQEAIFERFIQADIEDSKARQGVGLGLAITKSYVEMLGGKIWVESEEGIGSTFYFTLPYQVESVKETANQQLAFFHDTDPIRKLKILIAEDDEISEMLMDIEAKPFCKEILKTSTGGEAVEICRDNSDLDLILMDIRMPQMDGYEAAREIRRFNKKVIIVAQTAYALAGDRERALKAGCNDYLTKPINKAALFLLMQKYFGK